MTDPVLPALPADFIPESLSRFYDPRPEALAAIEAEMAALHAKALRPLNVRVRDAAIDVAIALVRIDPFVEKMVRLVDFVPENVTMPD